MRILLVPIPDQRHLLDRPDKDERLAWTKCGIRFVWGGKVSKPRPKLDLCQKCSLEIK